MKYTTSDKSIATVSDKGVVTGKSAGEAKITVTSVLNKKNKTTFKVTVKSQDLVDTVVDPTGTAKIVLAQNEVTLAPASSFDTGRVSTYYAQVAADKNKELLRVISQSCFFAPVKVLPNLIDCSPFIEERS